MFGRAKVLVRITVSQGAANTVQSDESQIVKYKKLRKKPTSATYHVTILQDQPIHLYHLIC